VKAPEIIGRYEVERELGRGGMAVVFLAHDPFMERQVAVKLLPRQFTFDAQFQARFQREARVIALLEHPAIVPVYDFGYSEEQPFIVMRYMPGGSLEDRIRNGPLSPQEAIRIFEQLAPALDYAHQQGVIHRDLKPGNILFDQVDNAFASDFGIAKISGSSVALTGSGFIGTPAYASPEQAMGKEELDGRSDVYAMGVVLFEMLTGKLPFEADTPMSLAMAHILEPVPDILELRPDLPKPYKALIERALAKERENRFATVEALVAALISAERDVRWGVQVPEIPEEDLSDRLQTWYDDGLGAYWVEDWKRARAHFKAIVEIQPDYQDAKGKLAEAERQLQMAALYEKGVAEMDARDWRAALAALEELVALEPEYRDTASRLGTARKQVQLADLYAQASRLGQVGQWQAVVNVFDHIRKLEPDYSDPEGLLASAKQGLEQEKRQKRLNDVYRRALEAMESGAWQEAQRLLQQVERAESGFKDAGRLLARVEGELAREGNVREAAVKGVAVKKVKAKKPAKRFSWAWMGGGLVGLVLLLGLVIGGSRLAGLLSAVTPTPAPPTNAPTSTSSPVTLQLPRVISEPNFSSMALVPAGSFEMGSEGTGTDESPPHTVYLDHFYMDQYEVTNSHYVACVEAGACSPPSNPSSYTRTSYYGDARYDDHPVINVSWEDAKKYCEWRGARLPTEAEWEKAARGGLEGERYPWGNTFDGSQVNFCDVNCDQVQANTEYNDQYVETAPVGSFAPNGYGLYDMAGSVWEWVADWYAPDYYGTLLEGYTNPTGPETGDARVLRGGSWSSDEDNLRAANRYQLAPGSAFVDGGFRCARSP